MPKIFFIVMMCLGIVMGIILFIENMIGSVGMTYTLIWETASQELVLFTLVCGAMIGYGFKGLISFQDEDENAERF